MTTTSDRLHEMGLYAPHDDEPMPGSCRVCGCTDHHACYDRDAGEPCHWVEDDLCSVCARGLR